MASKHVHEFNDDNFDDEVMESDTPVIVDFWAEWCSPCRTISPLIDHLASRHQGTVKVGKLDVEHSQDVSSRYKVTSMPTLILFKDGEEVDRVIGASPKKIQELFLSV